jgi:hypothetical protein
MEIWPRSHWVNYFVNWRAEIHGGKFYYRITSYSHFYIYINSATLIVPSWFFTFTRLYTRPNKNILPINVQFFFSYVKHRVDR